MSGTADNAFSDLVVIGSSAGGVEALSELVSTVPEDFPAPIVIAQHLEPSRVSHLEDVLSRRSTLPVRTVTEHQPLQAGVVFVVPANHHVNITDSEIDFSEDSRGRPMPSIDLLFGSAAKSFGEHLIAVILTGTGSDGTEGARIVSQAGGTVIVQNPETAEYSDMPGSLAPNTVDIVADMSRIGPILGELISGAEVAEREPEHDEKQALEGFLEELRERHGIDFRSYKTPTIMRRLRRRMVATDSDSVEDYTRYLNDHPDEYRQLINTFLIKVTEFFRDPELFAYLKEEVLPQLITEARESGRQLRIWSAGCATGEEAYSLAILVSEILGAEAALFDVRIFATDVDENAVNFARHGIYPASALSGLSEEQIRHYFVEENGQYQIKKPVRGMIVFGEHDLAQRSPFPRVDLVVSRNVLIYFTTELQRRALQLFAYALRQGGYLVLGKAESTSPLSEFFSPAHRQYKVYQRRGERFLMPPTMPTTPMPSPKPRRERNLRATRVREPSETAHGAIRARIGEENLLNQLPVGLIVLDRHYDIQVINSAARNLLSIRGAAVGEDLLHALQEVPYAEVRNTIDSAFREGVSTRAEFSIDEVTTGERRQIEEFRREEEQERENRELQNERLLEKNRQLEEANQELANLNEELQASYEESLIDTEEAQAATEEVETLNEELQATNEELETLNEELQATIEELNTTNDDLQARTTELQDLARTGEEERGRLRGILESIPEAVLVVDAAGRTMLTNEAYSRLFGETEFEALDTVGHPLMLDETPQTRVARGESFVTAFSARAQDGTRRSFKAEGKPIDGEDGKGGVIVVREVEEE